MTNNNDNDDNNNDDDNSSGWEVVDKSGRKNKNAKKWEKI